VHLIDFQPFLCEVAQLHRGDLPLHHLTKRQLVSPFNLYFNSAGLVELDARRVPQAASTRGALNAEPSIEACARTYRHFKKQELNLDLCEVRVSFNDLLCLKGIKRRLDEMDEAYRDYLGGVEVLAGQIFEPSQEEEADIDPDEEADSMARLASNLRGISGDDTEAAGIDQT
jgi:hypothetical protein